MKTTKTLKEKIARVVEIGDTLHSCGCAPFKIEKYTQFYAQKYDINVIVQASPTSLNYQFPDNNKIIIKRLNPASTNLGLLANTILRINKPDEQGFSQSPEYSVWLTMLAYIGIPPAYLSLVGSTIEAIAVSLVLGFLVWGCQMLCKRRLVIAVEFFSALIVGLTVSAMVSLGIDLPIWGVCIAAIVLFVPGLIISNSLECLAFNDLISGISLLGQAAIILIKLFIGIYIGLAIGEALWGHIESIKNVNEVPQWLSYIGLIVISTSLGIIFKARGVDIIYGFPVAILGMWGPYFLDFGSGLIVGTWITTVLITLYSTWLAKILDSIGALYVVQGIIVLVPGSRILIGASESLFGESFLSTSSIGLSALFIFSAIVAGQITAYSIYSQKIEQ